MAEAPEVIVPVEGASAEPYRLALAYPTPDEAAVNSRIQQLQGLGVTALLFQGPLKLDKVSLLGKGVAAMVIGGVVDNKMVALKVRRTDSRRSNMFREAKMLQEANSVGVGPRFGRVSSDILVMEFVKGVTLPVWLAGVRGRGSRNRVRTVVRLMLDQCRRLDSIWVDHGELSRAHKNVLVGGDGRPWILDFESSSSSRRPRNVTSLAQYLFLGRVMGSKMRRVLGPLDREGLLGGLRRYKAGEASAFDSVLETLKLG